MRSKKELNDALIKAHLVRASNDSSSGSYYLESEADHWIRVLDWVLERGSDKMFHDFGQELDEHVKDVLNSALDLS